MEQGKVFAVKVSDRSQAMLEAHVEFLARVSMPAARRLAAAYRKAVAGLRRNPERFPYYEEPYHKCLFCKRYELIFVILEKTVYIDAVRDCRQDPDKLPVQDGYS